MSRPTETDPNVMLAAHSTSGPAAVANLGLAENATPCTSSSQMTSISSLPPTQQSPGEPSASDATEQSKQAGGHSQSTPSYLASFRPTPHQIISCIAPHVFDERNKRRHAKQRRSAGESKGKRGCGGAVNRSSPLRGAVIIAWDEHSIYLGLFCLA